MFKMSKLSRKQKEKLSYKFWNGRSYVCKCQKNFYNGYGFSSHRCKYKKNVGAYILWIKQNTKDNSSLVNGANQKMFVIAGIKKQDHFVNVLTVEWGH